MSLHEDLVLPDIWVAADLWKPRDSQPLKSFMMIRAIVQNVGEEHSAHCQDASRESFLPARIGNQADLNLKTEGQEWLIWGH